MLRVILLTLIVWLVYGGAAFGQIAFVQSARVDGTGTQNVAFSSNNAAGNLIVVAIMIGNTTSDPTVSDTRGNTYTEDRRQTQTTDGHRAFVFSAPNSVAGANTVTVTITGTPTNRVMIHEYRGLATSSPRDQVNSGEADSSSTSDSGNVTTTVANELLFAMTTNNTTSVITAGTNFTARSEDANNRTETEDRIVGATGTYNATFTFAGAINWTCIIVTYKEQTGRSRALIGVGL